MFTTKPKSRKRPKHTLLNHSPSNIPVQPDITEPESLMLKPTNSDNEDEPDSLMIKPTTAATTGVEHTVITTATADDKGDVDVTTTTVKDVGEKREAKSKHFNQIYIIVYIYVNIGADKIMDELRSVTDVDELRRLYDVQQLKDKLTVFGLKVGGAPSERYQRLMKVKEVDGDLSKLPKKMFAKKK